MKKIQEISDVITNDAAKIMCTAYRDRKKEPYNLTLLASELDTVTRLVREEIGRNAYSPDMARWFHLNKLLKKLEA